MREMERDFLEEVMQIFQDLQRAESETIKQTKRVIDRKIYEMAKRRPRRTHDEVIKDREMKRKKRVLRNRYYQNKKRRL